VDKTTSRLAQLGNEAPSRDYLQTDESVLIELTPRYGTANTPVVPSVFVSVSRSLPFFASVLVFDSTDTVPSFSS
jgi:hypothetical protein